MSMRARIDAVIDRAIAERRIVGVAVMVAHEGEIAYARAAGLADAEGEKPVTLDTIFRFASLTKPIVAATALALLDKGLIALDAPVTEYLPWFRPALHDGRVPEITLKQLLTHTSGLAYGGPEFERLGVNGGLADSDISLVDNLKLLARVPLEFEPGTRWLYSKSIDVIGAVIAEVEGTSLGEAVRRYVTGPLGMHATGFLVTDASRLATVHVNTPTGPVAIRATYRTESGTFSPERILNPRAFHSGGAGMAGTAPEFLTFLEALRRGGDPILKPELVNLGASDQIEGIEREPGMGFGFFGAVVRDPVTAGVPWSRGTYEWGGVYGNRWFVDPSAGISVVWLTNTAPEGVDGPFAREIRDAIYPPVEDT